jgi:uncharacterized protein YecT (DUF1311 family)
MQIRSRVKETIMTRLALALIGLLILASPTAAASFDCAKASTPFEEAICADDALSLQDEVLAQAYATALGGLSKGAADEIKAAQRDWLGYAERSCSDDAEPITTDYTDEQKQCLATIFRSRVQDLEASRMLGGFRFYPIDRYMVEEDTEALPEDFNKVADKQFQIVKIDRDDDIAAAFNEAVDGMMAGQGTFFEPGTTEIAAGDVTSDYDISTKVTEVTANRISLQTTEYWYGHGAAHGNYFITHRHFLPGATRLLEASDIFEGDEWQETLGDLALEAIKAKLGEDYFATSDDDVKAIAIDPLRWSFAEVGLVIQFNIYEVTAYAMGAPVVTIPWDELSGFTTGRAEEIAYY